MGGFSKIATLPNTALLPNGNNRALKTSLRGDKVPHATRYPALLCKMKGLPSISFASVAMENVKEAEPNASVL
jgi:hypothetical protein